MHTSVLVRPFVSLPAAGLLVSTVSHYLVASITLQLEDWLMPLSLLYHVSESLSRKGREELTKL